jgi:3'(2'), 5'-bisphosphate nucleotidase
MDIKNYLPVALEAALKAGQRIMEIYTNEKVKVERKADFSPVTQADTEASAIIYEMLEQTAFPVITEEAATPKYNIRKNWDFFWMVDPLDGTKEFIKRNGEFTVNIALIDKNRPVLGIIFIPVLQTIYFGYEGYGSWKYKITGNELPSAETIINDAHQITAHPSENEIRFAVSRSHLDPQTKCLLRRFRKHSDKKITVVQTGSSAKFCLIAEGSADIYLRFSPTMEWDTAAGQAIAVSAGASMKDLKHNPFMYNKTSLKNEGFIVCNQSALRFSELC